MFINSEAKSLFPIKDLSNLYIAADFDKTITNGSSKTSWSVLSNSDFMPDSYIEERWALYNKYRPIELDTSLPFEYRLKMMKEWFQKHIELFVKFQVTEEIFEKAATDLRVMEFRPGAKEFITFLHENNIPLIIISAGIGNFIETFLKVHNCLFDNVYVVSNKVIFKDGIATGVDKNIIHSLNKNEVSLPDEITQKLENRQQVILLGDQVDDLNMVDKTAHDSVLTIGFVSEDNSDYISDLISNFDIVCDNEEDYTVLQKLLFM